MANILDANGNPIYPNIVAGAYFMNISIRHTAADAGASMVWAFRNPSAAKMVNLRGVRGRVVFDGTAAAGTDRGYEFVRFTTADPTTGTTVPRVKKRAGVASNIADANIQQKSGVLTMTGILAIEIFHVVRIPIAVTNGAVSFDFDPTAAGLKDEWFEFGNNEGFGIRLAATAATIGLGINGSVEIEER